MSPRKSSTSSADDTNSFLRPRYLAIEAAGDLPMPGRALERELLRRLEMIGVHQPRFRVIRWEGRRGLVRVAHTDVKRAREAWNGESVSPDGYRLRLATVRSHGTLRKGKLWLRTPSTSSPE